MAFEALWKARREELCNPEEFADDATLVTASQGRGQGHAQGDGQDGHFCAALYKGAQIFEAIGLQDGQMDLSFVGTASRVQGVNLDELAEEMLRRHALGFRLARRTR